MANVPLQYTADMSDIRKQLVQLSGLTETEVRKQLKSMDRFYKARAKAEANANKKTKESFKKTNFSAGTAIAQQMPDVISQLSSGTNALQIFAQQGLQVVQVSMMQATSTMKKLMPILTGPVGIGLAAGAAVVGAAFLVMSREIDRAADQAKFYAQVNDTLEPTLRKLETAHIDLTVAIGDLSKAEGDRLKRQIRTQQAILSFADAQKEQREELDDGIKSAERWIGITNTLFPAWAEGANLAGRAADAVFGWSQTIEDNTGKIGVLNRAVVTEAGAQSQLLDTLNDIADAEDQVTRSKRAHTEASKEAKRAAEDEARIQGEIRAQLLAADREAAEAGEQLAQIRVAAAESALAPQQQIGAELERQLALIDALGESSGNLSLAEETRVAVIAEAEAEISAIRAKASEEAAKLQQKQARDTLSAMGSLTAASGDAIGALMEANGNVSQDAMQQAFIAQQALGLANVAVRVAEGLVTAAALPPPADAIKAGAVVATGIASAATIKATPPPSFGDTPGPVRMADGGFVQLAPGDLVAASQTQEGLSRQTERVGDRNRRGSTVVLHPDRHWDRFGRDAMKASGPWKEINRMAGRIPGRKR